jgi:uncharacterized membrane protein HdeD (DUF308 family)
MLSDPGAMCMRALHVHAPATIAHKTSGKGPAVLKHKGKRRALGGTLLVAGGVLMWLAPESTFGTWSLAGLVLLLAGILVEIAGIALEHRDRSRR